ncbi:hypothetical protein [Rariglobus hedericola]|uniref:Alginate export domain-containing protein n=1 Tax=Rariglobus hedericola TaxID=2597822 RepID=A0A556QL32_9BACT|nr:hypothetical protein [Rariglobus hedericola]TSJ77363.1 hypothetical protein FPL22_14825 [Rariglobus hedericola]
MNVGPSRAESPSPPVLGERETPTDTLRPHQREARTPAPSAPEDTPVDPGARIPERRSAPEPVYRVERRVDTSAPAAPPDQFNPDPGASQRRAPAVTDPYFKTNQIDFVLEENAPVPPSLALPRAGVETTRITPIIPVAPAGDELTPLPDSQKLPREGVRENVFIHQHWHAPAAYPLSESGVDLPAHTTPTPDRWRDVGFTPWRRYTSGDTNEIPYANTETELWHPYRQSTLKGDRPVHGQDVFLSVTASAEFIFEDRKLTVPSGVSAATPGNSDFFGESRSQIFVSNYALDFLLFKGETVFKPVEWAFRVRPVFNVNRVDFREAGIVSPNPGGPGAGNGGAPVDNSGVEDPDDVGGIIGGGTSSGSLARGATLRTRNYLALQEAFFELHLADLSPNYDFVALKVGNQTFNSDFRGFIFNETNLGARIFGNYDNNHYQYNLAVFDLREKDTNSELNTFDSRDQRVLIANLYRQDFLTKGYTAQLSYHGNFDQGGTHYDRNGAIVRPAPIGSPVEHKVQAHYLGWAGDGHVGRWNVSHAAYLAVGHDDFNGLAGRSTDIFAQMAALEVSYDRDWIRYKASAFYASGDNDPTDGRATGFDSIVDNVNFTGGPFSYYTRQGFNLAGTAVGLKQRFSLLPNLRTSKTQGQSNFVNPGLLVFGVGADIEVTPKVRAFLSANYIRFVTAEPIKTALLTNDVDEEFGIDLGVGMQWRPLLTDNIIFSLGCGFLLPGEGFRDIYRRSQPVVPGFTTAGPQVDNWLYSAVAAVTFTY